MNELRLANVCVNAILSSPHESTYFLEKAKQQLEAEYKEKLREKDMLIANVLTKLNERSRINR